MNPKNFFGELKRRNVYKVAAAYGVVAWLLIQAASILLPTFDAPVWAMKALVTLVFLGFPVALVFSWAFEITPEGIKREADIASDARGRGVAAGRKIVALTVVIAVVAAGLFAFERLRQRSTKLASRAGTIALAAPEKSIAVLPFQNLSDEKSNAYFADGIQDEILTRLSKIAALKVISRTSTQRYKSAPENLREVGAQLGVAHLLEGSVQKVANKVLINVQLIRAASDEHLWAESYNRTLDDVFGVEGEVASAIADQLKAKLTGDEKAVISEQPTQNVAAYDAYLRALAIEHERFSYSNFQQAAAAYAEAVRLDPQFAVAWARLAIIRSFLYFNGLDNQTNSAAAVKHAVDQAVLLKPDAGEVWLAQGAYRYRVLRDFGAAVVAYDEARKRLPNSSNVLENLAFVERRLGRWNEAAEHYQRATELDPRDFQVFVSMGSEFLNYLRRFDEAQTALDRALEISPNEEDALANKADVYQNEGRLDEAAKVLALIPQNSTSDFVTVVRFGQASYERRFQDAVAILQANLTAQTPGSPLNGTAKIFLVSLGYCQEWAGQRTEAMATFARAAREIKPSPESVLPLENLGLPYYLALAYAGLGEKEKALAQAREAVAAYRPDAIVRPRAEIALAQIQARFGESEAALAALPHLLEVPAGLTTGNLRLDPMWDPLRNDSRFQKLAYPKP